MLQFRAVIPEPIGYELKQQLKIRQLRINKYVFAKNRKIWFNNV